MALRTTRPLDHLDLAAAGVLAVAAAAATALPEGSALRVALTLPFLLLVPGYAFMQALLPHASKPLLLGIGIGIGLPLVGLLAWSTSLVEGGFRPAAIVAVTTIGTLALAGTAFWRRMRSPAPTAAEPAAA